MSSFGGSNNLSIHGETMYFFFKGRVALYTILKAMGIKPGDEVILPGYTCVVVPNAIMYLGAIPVYVDINPETYNIDPALIKEKITDKTRAVLAQHTYGIPADIDAIKEVTAGRGIYIIEDACHSIGSTYKGRPTGSLGDAAFFSSQWSKPLTTGLGGWAVVNNPELAKKVEEISADYINPSAGQSTMLWLQYLAYSALFRPALFWYVQSFYRWLYKRGLAVASITEGERECRMPEGYMKTMCGWQKRMIKRKLADIDKTLAHRRHVTSVYENMLRAKGIKTVELPDWASPVYLRYPVRVADKDATLAEAKAQRIELGDWFHSPVHERRDGWEMAGYYKGSCPIAEKASREVINLPTHSGIAQADIERIVSFVIERAIR